MEEQCVLSQIEIQYKRFNSGNKVCRQILTAPLWVKGCIH